MHLPLIKALVAVIAASVLAVSVALAPATGGRLVRDRYAIAIGSSRPRTATNTQSVKR
jgi:hypothetical protein